MNCHGTTLADDLEDQGLVFLVHLFQAGLDQIISGILILRH